MICLNFQNLHNSRTEIYDNVVDFKQLRVVESRSFDSETLPREAMQDSRNLLCEEICSLAAQPAVMLPLLFRFLTRNPLPAPTSQTQLDSAQETLIKVPQEERTANQRDGWVAEEKRQREM